MLRRRSNTGRLAAVLEVIAVVLPHEGVAEATEINPEMRELMREERPGVEQLTVFSIKISNDPVTLACTDRVRRPLLSEWAGSSLGTTERRSRRF